MNMTIGDAQEFADRIDAAARKLNGLVGDAIEAGLVVDVSVNTQCIVRIGDIPLVTVTVLVSPNDIMLEERQ